MQHHERRRIGGRQDLRLLLLLTLAWFLLAAQWTVADTEGACRTRNLTLDGVRWQEVFDGIDAGIHRDPASIRYRKTFADFERDYWRESNLERRRILMPFLWSEVAVRGQLHGDRRQGSRVAVANPLHFSYPGYSEILTGIVDPRIASNDKTPNPNRTVLEWLNGQPAFAGRVAAFGSWDVLPYIVNEPRARVPVNAGFEALALPGDAEVALLNELQAQIPSPWDTVRLDAFTHRFALAWLAERRPRVLFVAYGETDDFAHDGWYDLYARAATRSDEFIAELWAWVQADPEYRDRTTLIVTTDHGRGRTLADWRHHGPASPDHPAGFPGDEETWLAVLGPDTPALGAVRDGPDIVAASVPATVAQALGLVYEDDHPDLEAAGPIPGVIDCAGAR
jgi:hypothetical protein